MTVFYREERKDTYFKTLDYSLDFNPTKSDSLAIDKLIISRRGAEPPIDKFISVLVIDEHKQVYYPKSDIANDTIENTISYGKKEGHMITVLETPIRDSISYRYIDFETKQRLRAIRLKEKKYLVYDDIPSYNWKITHKKKRIGKYQCKKAVIKRRGGARKNTKEIEAWFTEEIDCNYGPKGYWGLPGLILELKTVTTNIFLDRIVLDTDSSMVDPHKDLEKVSEREMLRIVLSQTPWWCRQEQ